MDGAPLLYPVVPNPLYEGATHVHSTLPPDEGSTAWGVSRTPLQAVLSLPTHDDQGDQHVKKSCSDGRCLHAVAIDEYAPTGLCYFHAKVQDGLIDSYYDLDGETVTLKLP